MKLTSIFFVMLATLLLLRAGVATAQEMSKDRWQQEMNNFTSQRNDVQAKLKALTDQVANLQAQSTKLDADYKKCLDELYGLVGSDAEKAEAYRAEIEAAESKADELSKFSSADLAERRGEVDALKASVKRLWGNKLSLIPEIECSEDR
jgi:uncharacterized protein Yka (UPF0111/DUF47 family)